MKLDRLLAITMLLLNRDRVSAKELSDRFEVSMRTIYRDLETINMAGIPIVSYSGAQGGYEIMDRFRLERQFLSMEELQSIVIALKGIRSALGEEDIALLLDKVGTLVDRTDKSGASGLSGQLLVDFNPWQGGERYKEKLSILREAIRENRFIAFAYTSSQGEASERRCEPMGLVLKGFVWYLYGYCSLREDFRVFRLSRIEELRMLQDTFERRPETLEQLDYRWRRQEAPPVCVKLVLEFQPGAKARVRDYFVHGEIVTRPDGTLLVTAHQPEEPWLYSMLLGYGADVRILEPESVAQAVRAKAEEVVKLYSGILT
ncbi:YafY family protein [Paenibacillus filicis]|uniref:YafY family protein n=1 Tax=Paenibacillus gyeongsangnamensis TaxID=3388067 RepID=A0ABT4QH84_9BACL|nr:YafY family protein [Paenibacillus filicis]MCZ8516233.1 YafY family protein [Paenibacillus filicis]